MDIHRKYVVYELNRVMGNEKHLSLEKVEFDGFVQNSFDSENEAVQALLRDKKTYEEYLIILQVYIN